MSDPPPPSYADAAGDPILRSEDSETNTPMAAPAYADAPPLDSSPNAPLEQKHSQPLLANDYSPQPLHPNQPEARSGFAPAPPYSPEPEHIPVGVVKPGVNPALAAPAPGDQKDDDGTPLQTSYTYRGDDINKAGHVSVPQEDMPEGIRKVHVQTRQDGFEVRDLPEDEKEVVHFLQKHNTPPEMEVSVRGTHTETYTTTDSDGNRKTETRTVTDFHYGIDVSKYINPYSTLNVDEMWPHVKHYIDSTNPLKRLILSKHVPGWDYVYIREAITSRIRSLGYRHTISVSFPLKHDKVIVAADNDCSRCCRSPFTDCFMWITCLCILFYPLKWAVQEDIEFTSPFSMTIGAEEWFKKNVGQIHR